MINFDNAATTFPKPETVRKTAVNAIENLGGNAGRGGHALAMRTSEAVFSARQTIADFFGAEPENVVFTMNCTQAINMAIQGIMSGGGHMIISGMEHNSSARPASELARNKKITLSVAQVYPDDRRTVESFRSLIHKDTKAIVCTLASNVTGQILPYREIAHICREKNICFIADGAQACGIIDINMNDGINILCTAGHKGLYGITGTGLLISDGKYKIKPIIQGGTGSASSSLYQPDFLPDSLESGTLNVTGAMTIKAGIEFIRKTGIEKIFAHEERICRTFINLLRKNKDIIIYRNPESSYVPIVSFNVKGIMPEKVAEILAEYGYCLRAGYHCSALAHTQLGTENGTIRFAPSVFSRESDAIKLAELVRIVTVSEKSHKTIEII
ncbi:MAG: aminotransferase class V-fold PLP-dependent enzyme [Ruminococcus sp.]|nr:aminotransferase class V-fold PLP-dependent enzyme [Ruminococcus sp.]